MMSQPLLRRLTPQDPMAVLPTTNGLASLTLSGSSMTKITLAILIDKRLLLWRKLPSLRLATARLSTKTCAMPSFLRLTLMVTELSIRPSCSAS